IFNLNNPICGPKDGEYLNPLSTPHPALRAPLSYKERGWVRGGHLISTKRATPTGLEVVKL
ncbi:MAG TPA: hypothetical protein PLD12_11930, partial [Bacteroidales bacterium]|nr:hypothetical protein [Bacteroidales bacterium]